MRADGIAVRDRAIHLPGPDTLVLADLHLGRDERTGIALDLRERASIVDRFSRLLADLDPIEAVVAGDVLDDFQRVPRAARGTLAALAGAARRRDVDLVLVAGNHDTQLRRVTTAVTEHALADGTVICHGHEPPTASASRYVVGHDHPAIVIEGRRRPCVLVGESVYRDRDVIALPAFSDLCTGTAVNTLEAGDLSSPLLADLDAFRPVVRDPATGETHAFPPLHALREHL